MTSVLNVFARKQLFVYRKCLLRINRCSTSSKDVSGHQKKLEDYFFDQRVQSILKKITGMNYEKIFAPKKQKQIPPTYEFVTDSRLKELQDIARAKAASKLQMPPVLQVQDSNPEVLSRDPELQGYLSHKLVFTDVSPGVSSRERVITVRETDGTLRKATQEERFRMNQIFVPMDGRNLETPKYFESPHLERILEEGSYLFLLDSACVQFEPDNAEYHRVTSATYEHINLKKKFDMLRSTRHFGPMAFYLAYKNNVDNLLVDMIERQLLSDVADAVKLLSILHPELNSSLNVDQVQDLEIVQNYITTSKHKANLELALQTYLELQAGTDKQEALL